MTFDIDRSVEYAIGKALMKEKHHNLHRYAKSLKQTFRKELVRSKQKNFKKTEYKDILKPILKPILKHFKKFNKYLNIHKKKLLSKYKESKKNLLTLEYKEVVGQYISKNIINKELEHICTYYQNVLKYKTGIMIDDKFGTLYNKNEYIRKEKEVVQRGINIMKLFHIGMKNEDMFDTYVSIINKKEEYIDHNQNGMISIKTFLKNNMKEIPNNKKERILIKSLDLVDEMKLGLTKNPFNNIVLIKPIDSFEFSLVYHDFNDILTEFKTIFNYECPKNQFNKNVGYKFKRDTDFKEFETQLFNRIQKLGITEKKELIKEMFDIVPLHIVCIGYTPEEVKEKLDKKEKVRMENNKKSENLKDFLKRVYDNFDTYFECFSKLPVGMKNYIKLENKKKTQHKNNAILAYFKLKIIEEAKKWVGEANLIHRRKLNQNIFDEIELYQINKNEGIDIMQCAKRYIKDKLNMRLGIEIESDVEIQPIKDINHLFLYMFQHCGSLEKDTSQPNLLTTPVAPPLAPPLAPPIAPPLAPPTTTYT